MWLVEIMSNFPATFTIFPGQINLMDTKLILPWVDAVSVVIVVSSVASKVVFNNAIKKYK